MTGPVLPIIRRGLSKAALRAAEAGALRRALELLDREARQRGWGGPLLLAARVAVRLLVWWAESRR